MANIDKKCLLFIAVILFVIESSDAGVTTLDRVCIFFENKITNNIYNEMNITCIGNCGQKPIYSSISFHNEANVLESFLIGCTMFSFEHFGKPQNFHHQFFPLCQQTRSLQPFPRKRPFCNAFTGCGRKRSDIPAKHLHHNAATTQEEYSNDIGDNDMSSSMDFNSEPAVEELMRQIMSESRLWEAIQEAGMEMDLQRQHNNARSYPVSFAAQ
jgi:Arthropod cardioacceleratory peptide 2a